MQLKTMSSKRNLIDDITEYKTHHYFMSCYERKTPADQTMTHHQPKDGASARNSQEVECVAQWMQIKMTINVAMSSTQ